MSRPPAPKGQHGQVLGCSRGGFSTKIHLKTDFDGQPLAFHLTGGEASDSRRFETLLDIGPDISPQGGADRQRPRCGAEPRSGGGRARLLRRGRAPSILSLSCLEPNRVPDLDGKIVEAAPIAA